MNLLSQTNMLFDQELHHRINSNVHKILTPNNHFFEFKFPVIKMINGKEFKEQAFLAIFQHISFGEEKFEFLEANGRTTYFDCYTKIKLVPRLYWDDYKILRNTEEKSEFELIISVFDIEYVTINNLGPNNRIKWIL